MSAISLLVSLLAWSGPVSGQDWDAWRGRLEEERVRLQALLKNAGPLIERVEAIELERRSALAALPEGFEAARLLESMTLLAEGCGAELRAFEPGRRAGSPPVIGLGYELRLGVARLGDAACVAAGLVRLERILTLEGFQVQTGAERAEARLELTAWAYRPDESTERPAGARQPAVLPAGASPGLIRLQAEVVGLRRRADQVQALLARSERLRAGLGAVAELRQRDERQQGLGPFLRAMVTADPHPGSLRWAAGRIQLGGQVEDRSLLELVRDTPLPQGVTLSAEALEVRPELDPVMLDSLPDLSVGRVGKLEKPLVIHAVNADPLAVRAALRLWDQPLVHLGSMPERLTGRITARDARQALAALVAASPRLGRPSQIARPNQRGRGRRVSLQFFHADTHKVLRLLAEVGGINLVAPGRLPEVTILARNLPWDGVLGSIAEKADRRVERIGKTHYLLPKDRRLPRVRLPPGRQVDLRLERAWAAEAIGLLRQAVPGLDRTCLCGQGDPVTLTLRNVSPREALTAILVASGAELVKAACQPPACSPPAGGAATSQPGRLVGVLTGGHGAALVRLPDGPPRLVQDGGRLAGATVRVRRDGLSLVGPEAVAAQLVFEDPGWDVPTREDPRALLGRLRLAATLTGQGPATAIFEDTRDGAVRIVRDGDPLDTERHSLVRVSPGRVELEWRSGLDQADPPAPKRVFHLRPRAQVGH